MTEATNKTAISAAFPINADDTISFRLLSSIAISSVSEILAGHVVTMTLDASGNGLDDIPTPDTTGDNAWLWEVSLPDGREQNIAIGYDAATQDLAVLFAAVQSSTTPSDVSALIANKQDKDTDATDGNAAKFDADGNTVDAGFALGTAAAADTSDFDAAGDADAAQAAIDVSPGSTALAADVSSGSTITTRNPLDSSLIGSYIALVSANENTEVFLITGVSGTTVSLDDAIVNSHSSGDTIKLIDGKHASAFLWGAYPGLAAATLATRLQAAIDACTGKVTVSLGFSSYAIGTAQLVMVAGCHVVGAGTSMTNITHTGTDAAVWMKNGRATLENVTVSGGSTGVYGVKVGNDSGVGGVGSQATLRNVRTIANTTAGIQFVGGQICQMFDCYFDNNGGAGCIIDDTAAAGSNVALDFYSCSFSDNTGEGLVIRSGAVMNFYSPVIQNNGNEGLLVNLRTAGHAIQQIYFDGTPYFEQNNSAQGSGSAQVYVNSSATGDAIVRQFTLRRPYFSGTKASSFDIHLKGARSLIELPSSNRGHKISEHANAADYTRIIEEDSVSNWTLESSAVPATLELRNTSGVTQHKNAGGYMRLSDYTERVKAINSSAVIWRHNDRPGATVTADSGGNRFQGAISGALSWQNDLGNGDPAIFFDGSNDYINIYSAAFDSFFTGNTFTLLAWCKVSAAGVWSDGATRRIVNLFVDASNYLRISKNASNLIEYVYASGGTSRTFTHATTSTGWMQIGITVGSGTVIPYFNGAAISSNATGTWAGALGATSTVIGAQSTSGTNGWSGWLGPVAIIPATSTAADISALSAL